MPNEYARDDFLLTRIYANLAKVDIEKWSYEIRGNAIFFTLSLGDLTVELYRKSRNDVVGLKIYSSDNILSKKPVYEIATDDAIRATLYKKIEEKYEERKVERLVEKDDQQRCAPLEQVLAALEQSGKKQNKKQGNKTKRTDKLPKWMSDFQYDCLNDNK